MRNLIRFALCVCLTLPLTAAAQAAEPAPVPGAPRAKTSRIRAAGGGEIRLAPVGDAGSTELGPAIEVKGKLAKPGVVYVLARASVRWSDLQTQPDFVRKIARDALRYAP